jgi:hypothetical protein
MRNEEDWQVVETDGTTQAQITKQLDELHRMVYHGTLAVRRQLDDSPIGSYPEAASMVQELVQRLEAQGTDLDQRLRSRGERSGTSSPVSGASPPEQTARASQAVEGDHDFLQRLSLAYLELQSTSQAAGDQETAELAARGYQDTQSLIRDRISRVKPSLAAAEHAADSPPVPGTAN